MTAITIKLKTAIAALQADESLLDCVLEMVDTIDDEQGSLKTGDDAEDAVTDVVRRTGRTLLAKWARKKEAQVGAMAASDQSLRPHEKKRSSGIHPSEM